MTTHAPHDAYDPFADARKAASVIVLRDLALGGVEVLMLRRAERDGDLRSGAAVFPGGVLDARDREAHRHCLGWDDEAASLALRLAEGGLDYLVAAARESFEEVGLLFLSPQSSAGQPEGLLDPGFHAAAHAQAHAEWREPMQRGERSIAA
ncbi:MAG: hypothetical protein ACKOD9_02055, partial [Rubrivivax sp.]